ncbi:LOW QUALITY PROTEIN: fibronectin type-III domain-containing protein 3A-like [Haliotis rubra]|uniref:LOW QUALITY PROTEIN: fibronectin type-III domain-containing protein 3A-like n=1 Tax=Haliotis rubra TaxID=36100 RepID=UPI001EE5B67B|nr:LOW QUALITY PROTEIN: fibronectin type-III domain-containing protein 3A-like [Haliotis rubra]
MVKIKILTRRDREGERATKMSEHKDRNQNCSSVTSGPACVTATEENGHLSADDTLKNGVTPENNIPSSNSNTQQSVQSNRVNSPNSSRPSVNHRSGSPNSYSGSNAHSRGGSPQTGSSGGQSGNSPPNHQHVVHVHVNPGETFSVRLGDQIQHIQGPATVRMVSNNGPPLPMPMQVPPGHMVQQIVDEYGILTHVILSPQPPVPGSPMTGGPNSASQYYPNPYGPHYTTHPQYTTHPPHHHPHAVPPHMHSGMPHIQTPPQHNHCNTHAPVHSSGPSPPVNSPEDRNMRQRSKVRKKLERRRTDGYYQQTRPPTRRRGNPGVNGEVHTSNSVSNMSTSENGPTESEEDNSLVIQSLSNMSPPKVTDIEARSALIQISPPDVESSDIELDQSDFKYELLLSDKGRDTKYKPVYKGDATEITLKDLKPATEYHLRVCTILHDDLKGNQTDSVSFRTAFCEPEAPQPPKLVSKTRNNIQLKWAATCENGSKISTYTLEYDQGNRDGNFVEIYNGLQRQYRANKLQASTRYTFRLAAINSIGKSPFSEPVSFYTSGSIPSQPDPPMLSEPFVYALTVSWIKRPNDDEFLLQMEDEATGHGFLPAYNGPNLSCTIKNLRRNTEYKFKLAAKNDEGQSKWSDIVAHRTLPERPTAPPKPQIKGKIFAHNFRVIWDPPADSGGSEITKFVLELDDGEGYDIVYEGSEREQMFDHLVPGHTYRVRVACYSLGGRSEFSDCCVAITQPICPGQCHPPKLQGKPKATSLHLRWSYPSYDGGSSVTSYAAQMITPDNTTREVYRGHDLDCIVAGLSPGRPYLFQVRAFNRAGGGPWSDPLEVVSGAGVPDPPKAPQVNCRSPHSAIISWEEPFNNGAMISEYRLEWQQRADNNEFSQLYLGPNLSYEVKGLTPATLYSFRVQAINSAGSGLYSSSSSCVTPPSSPASIVAIKPYITATSIMLMWREPHNNGSDIISYNIDIGEKQLLSIEPVTEYTVEDLLPETTYRIRIQAVNSIGVGTFSTPVKVTTKALPPNPPKIECVNVAPNSLKLKWGDGRNPDMITYHLEMEKDDGSFQTVYSGPAHNHKVNRLTELTSYEFRIYACNEAGQGPYSDTYTFSTTKAPPPAMQTPSVSKLSLTSCVVEWQSCRQMGSDTIVYLLQVQRVDSHDHEYKQVYRGPNTQFMLENLQPKSDYHVRVCAIRQCDSGLGDIMGAYSQGRGFSTLSPQPTKQATTRVENNSKLAEPKPLTDQQWATIIFVGFVIVAFVIAFVTQQVINMRHSSR